MKLAVIEHFSVCMGGNKLEKSSKWDKKVFWLGKFKSSFSAATFSPDSNDLAPVERDPIHLGDKDGGHRLIKRCAVHVNGRAHWEHKTCYSLVDAQVLLQAPECDRQGTGTAANKVEEKVKIMLFGTVEINQL